MRKERVVFWLNDVFNSLVSVVFVVIDDGVFSVTNKFVEKCFQFKF